MAGKNFDLAEQIDYEALEKLAIGKLSELLDIIEAYALERGFNVTPEMREAIMKELTDCLEDIHLKNFIKNKQRKIEKWFKKQWKKLWRM